MLKQIINTLTSHPINQMFNLGRKQVAWKKVGDLQAGMGIAIENDGHLDWDEIVSVKKVGRERVYDIEVEGTHNFVGNGILAHNTYISGNVGVGTASPGTAKLTVIGGNVGIGTTNPLEMLHVSDNIRGEMFIDDTDSSYYLDPASSGISLVTAGKVGIGTLNPGTAGLAVMNGNVGIGNTSPLARLDLKSAGTGTDFGFRLQDSGGTDRVVMQSNGNVGIGTTNPLQKLHIRGSAIVDDGSIAADSNSYLQVNNTTTSTGANVHDFLTQLSVNPASSTSYSYRTLKGAITTPTANAANLTSSAALMGLFFENIHQGSGTVTGQVGLLSASGTLGASGGDVTENKAVWARIYNLGTNNANQTSAYGTYADVSGTGSTISNYYAYYLAPLSSGITNKWGVYINDTAAQNYFGGNVGIGTTNPDAYKLNVTGGDTYLSNDLVVNGSDIKQGGSGDLTLQAGTSGTTGKLILKAAGTTAGSGNNGSIYFYKSDGTTSAGRIDTTTAGGSETADQSQTAFSTAQVTYYVYYGNGSTSNIQKSQSFTAGASGNLSKVIFKMARNETAYTYSVYVDVYACPNDAPQGNILATSNSITSSTLSSDTTNGADVNFTFSTPPNLASGTKYCAVVKGTSTSDSTHYSIIKVSTATNPYASGQVAHSANAGETWDTASYTSIDAYFYTYIYNRYGSLYIGRVNTADADVAENYPSIHHLQPGEIVIPDPDRAQSVIRSQVEYDASLMGVVSTSPGLLLGSSDSQNNSQYPIALSGRVPIRVSLSNGPIKIGDAITSSSIAGVGIKATSPGPVVAKALENLESCDSEYCTIMSFVTLQYVEPQLWISDNGQVVILENYNSTGGYQLAGQNGQALSKRVANFTKSMIAMLEAGVIKTQDLIVNRRARIKELEVEKLAINQVPLDEYIGRVVGQLANQKAVAELTSPLPAESKVGDIIPTSNPVPAISEPTVNTSLGQLLADDIQTKSLNAKTVQTTTLLAQQLQAQELDSASISAEQILTDKIEAHSARIAVLQAGMAELESVRAVTAELVTATISGTLYAQHIDRLDEQIAQALKQPDWLKLLSGQITAVTRNGQLLAETVGIVESANFEATSSASLNLTLADLGLVESDTVISGQATFIDNYLKVNGTAYIADSLGIGHQLLIGERLQITDSYLAFTANPATPELNTFFIQPSGKGTLTLMANLLILDETGQVTINGNLSIAGDTTVEGTLLANLLQPDDFGNPFQVQVAGLSSTSGEVKDSRFEIVDETGTPVATISAEGRAKFAGGIGVDSQDLTTDPATNLATSQLADLTATQSAGLTIGATPNALPTLDTTPSTNLTATPSALLVLDSTTFQTNKTSGKAAIPTGKTAITIVAQTLTANSLIYITPVGTTHNQVLYVKSQLPPDTATGRSGQFTVGFDTPTQAKVEFNWWIVN